MLQDVVRSCYQYHARPREVIPLNNRNVEIQRDDIMEGGISEGEDEMSGGEAEEAGENGEMSGGREEMTGDGEMSGGREEMEGDGGDMSGGREENAGDNEEMSGGKGQPKQLLIFTVKCFCTNDSCCLSDLCKYILFLSVI